MDIYLRIGKIIVQMVAMRMEKLPEHIAGYLADISLHILAYYLNRVIQIPGTGPLLAVIRTRRSRRSFRRAGAPLSTGRKSFLSLDPVRTLRLQPRIGVRIGVQHLKARDALCL
jgi:hypothetical protein